MPTPLDSRLRPRLPQSEAARLVAPTASPGEDTAVRTGRAGVVEEAGKRAGPFEIAPGRDSQLARERVRAGGDTLVRDDHRVELGRLVGNGCGHVCSLELG